MLKALLIFLLFAIPGASIFDDCGNHALDAGEKVVASGDHVVESSGHSDSGKHAPEGAHCCLVHNLHLVALPGSRHLEAFPLPHVFSQPPYLAYLNPALALNTRPPLAV